MSLSREPRMSRIRDRRKSLKASSVRQNARACQRKPSKAMACGAIQRHRGSGLDKDWYCTSIASNRRIALPRIEGSQDRRRVRASGRKRTREDPRSSNRPDLGSHPRLNAAGRGTDLHRACRTRAKTPAGEHRFGGCGRSPCCGAPDRCSGSSQRMPGSPTTRTASSHRCGSRAPPRTGGTR